MVLKGLLVAGLRSKRICVSAQRNPEKKEAEMMRKKPMGLNSASPATIMMTPAVIVAMIRISFTEGCSRWNKNAKIRMNASADDLHMAEAVHISLTPSKSHGHAY